VEYARLDNEDEPARPIAVAGTLGECTADALAGAPTAKPEGAFRVYESSPGRWVSVPEWRAVALMRRPVALLVDACDEWPELLPTRGRNEEERRRLREGPGLLLVDRDPLRRRQMETVDVFAFAGDDGRVVLRRSGDGEGSLGKVYLLVGPQKLEMDAGPNLDML